MIPQNIPYGELAFAAGAGEGNRETGISPQTRAIMAALSGQGYSVGDFLASPNQQQIWSQLQAAAAPKPPMAPPPLGATNPMFAGGNAPPGPGNTGLAPGTGPLLNAQLMSTPEIQKILGNLGTVNFGFPRRAVWGQ